MKLMDRMPAADPALVIERLTQRLYSAPILRNDLRGELVEEIVAIALEPAWVLCGGDWAAFDLLHHQRGLRMQVKQSAARQSWHREVSPRPKPRYSIAHKTGRWEGDKWIPEHGRHADIFVFAWHPVTDQTADHRDPYQWTFFVLPTTSLPASKYISLDGLLSLAPQVEFVDLRAAVEAVSVSL